MKLKQNIELKLGQKLSPQQILLMNLVELDTLALEKEIKNELEENPTLDTVDDDDTEELGNEESYKYQSQHHFYDSPYTTQIFNYSNEQSFIEKLREQLITFQLDEKQRNIVDFLIGTIDGDGYIRKDLYEIMDDMTFTQNIDASIDEMEYALDIIHQMDPAGIGARSLKECLLLQLYRQEQTPTVKLTIEVLKKHYEHIIKKHYDKPINQNIVTKEQLTQVLQKIEKLNPKPGSVLSEHAKNNKLIIPDFIIRIENEKLELQLNQGNIPPLKVSKEYYNILGETNLRKREQKEVESFIKQKINTAKFFIQAIKQRQQTLYKTMNAILQKQYDYFLSGSDNLLKPMTMKSIAETIQVDISTVSRAVSNKYVDAPYGIVRIKDLFTDATVNKEGEEISTIHVKNALLEIINKEDKTHPLSDDKIVELLKEKRFIIARRTVAKYREQLQIPVSRLRKKF